MEKELIAKLLEMVKSNEWQTRHAAENKYCPYCANDNDAWDDQREHHAGCQFVAIVAEAEKFLAG